MLLEFLTKLFQKFLKAPRYIKAINPENFPSFLQ